MDRHAGRAGASDVSADADVVPGGRTIRRAGSTFWGTDDLTLESERLADVLALLAVAVGVWLRLRIATTTYLNPDEAIFFFAGSAETAKGLWDNVVRSQHAPLPIVVLHFIERINTSELALRFLPLVAGSMFPWVVYRWLGAAWSRTAGLIALVVLMFSPALVSLSAQARGYTLVLLLAALALHWLDTGLAARSAGRLLASVGCTALAVLTEFSAVFFAAGAAVYFLVRLRDRLPGRLVVLWAVGQGAVGVIIVALYLQIAAPSLANPTFAGMSEVFAGGYQQPDQSLVVFLAAGTVRQFSFLFGSHVAGVVAIPFFAVALVGLWLKKRYALAALLATPILTAWVGAALSHPFGRSRHTAILALVVAAGVAIGIDLILRRRAVLLVPALALLLPLTGWPDVGDIPPGRHRRDSIVAAVRYLQANVPPDGVLFCDRETGLILHYYLRDAQHPLPNWQLLREVHFGDLYMVANRSWDFGDSETFAADLAWLRQLLGPESKRPIWVVDGGFTPGFRSRLLRRYPHLTLPEAKSFDDAVEVFKLPPDF
jgi:Dolichyl-phosphate-mannose-protein mannosyltransferase